VDPLRTALASAIAELESIRDGAVEAYEAQIGDLLEGLEAEAAQYRAALADGGRFQVELEAEVAAFKAQVSAAAEAFAQWDGRLDLDCTAAAQWLGDIADACRQVAAQEPVEGDPWPEILRTVAVPAIDAWRGRHEEEVVAQYDPEVPSWELAAVDQAVAELPDDLPADAVAEVERARAACAAYRGRRGREALYGFWAAEAELASAIERAVGGA
jgi:hypothetical protein